MEKKHKRLSNGTRSSHFFEAIMDAIPDLIFVRDRELRYVFVNKAHQEFLGRSKGELIGVTPDYTYPKEVAAIFRKENEEVFDRGSIIDDPEVHLIDANGTTHIFHKRITPVRNGKGKVTHLVGIMRDITERKRGEEQYRRLFEDSPISLCEEDFSEVKGYLDGLLASGVKNFRAYFEDHPEDVARCAAMIKIINVNKATVDLYKAKSKEGFQRNLSRILAEESYQEFKDELIALAEGKTKFEIEGQAQTLTGDNIHIILSGAVAPGYEETLAKIILSIIDITELRYAREQIKQQQEVIMKLTSQLVDPGKDTIMLPLMGIIDTPLVKQLTDAVLERIAKTKPKSMS